MIKIEFYRGEIYFKASDVIAMLGYPGKVNVTNFVKGNTYANDRVQLSGRDVWFVNPRGLCSLLSSSKSSEGVALKEKIATFLGSKLKEHILNHQKDGEIDENKFYEFI